MHGKRLKAWPGNKPAKAQFISVSALHPHWSNSPRLNGMLALRDDCRAQFYSSDCPVPLKDKLDIFFAVKFTVVKQFTSDWDLNPCARVWTHVPVLKLGHNPVWDLNSWGWNFSLAKTRGLPTEITYLVSGLNDGQILCISVWKEQQEANW